VEAVMNTTSEPGEFSASQRAGLDARQADQDRTLACMHHLEAMLGQAAPGRQEEWSSEVLEALVALDEATAEEADNADSPDSLLSDVARTQPWLRNRVRGLRLQHRQLRAAVASLRVELEGQAGLSVDYADLRQRLGWILTGLRHQRARESDLIYEAYYDAFRADLPAETGSGSPPHQPRPATRPDEHSTNPTERSH
jgi:hypothetical protein